MSRCNCEEWKKRYKCNHVIAISYSLDKFSWPALDLEIEGKRPAGRPRKVDKALTRTEASDLTKSLFPSIPLDDNQQCLGKRKNTFIFQFYYDFIY